MHKGYTNLFKTIHNSNFLHKLQEKPLFIYVHGIYTDSYTTVMPSSTKVRNLSSYRARNLHSLSACYQAAECSLARYSREGLWPYNTSVVGLIYQSL